jgi:hypothetical protein
MTPLHILLNFYLSLPLSPSLLLSLSLSLSPSLTLGGLGRLTGGLITTAGVVLTLPSVILSLPAAAVVAQRNQRLGPTETPSIGYGAGLYLSLMGILSIPGVVVAAVGRAVSGAGQYAMKDKETMNYKVILKKVLSLLGEKMDDIFDEISPLENLLVIRISQALPNCNIETATEEEIFTAIKLAAKDSKNKAMLDMKQYVKRNKGVLTKIRLIGHIYQIRRILENSVVMCFMGVKGAGQSTVINQLFDVHASPDSEHILTDPQVYKLGRWVEKAMERSQAFHEWIERNDRKLLHIYAINIPGFVESQNNDLQQLDGRVSPSVSSTPPANSANSPLFSNVPSELASVCIVVLHGGPVTPEEIWTVQQAQENHKPYVIIVHFADRTSEKLTSRGQVENMREEYARKLNAPEDLIHFTRASDHAGIDKLRGLLFGMVQNLVSNRDMVSIAALRFIPECVINDLLDENTQQPSSGTPAVTATPTPTSTTHTLTSLSEEKTERGGKHDFDILSVADILSTAACSGMFNLSPLTAEVLRDTVVHLIGDADVLSRDIRKQETVRDFRSLPLAVSLQLQQIATMLQISDDAYAVFAHVFRIRLETLRAYLTNENNLPPALLDLMKKSTAGVEHMLSVLVLSALRESIQQFFGDAPRPGRDDIQYLGTEV